MAVNASKIRDKRFWEKWRESGAISTISKVVKMVVEKTILVWNEGQRVPASVYGDANFGRGRYEIIVCDDPNPVFERMGREKALIYHHS